MRGAVVIIKQRCAVYALDTNNGRLKPRGPHSSGRCWFQWPRDPTLPCLLKVLFFF